jgi:predicted transcriptional regulator of viral defense system
VIAHTGHVCESTNVFRKPANNVEFAINERAGRQHRVITTEQLVACGCSSAGITRRLRTGRLRRVHRGVYAVGPGPLTFEGRCLAAVLAAGPGSFVTGRAAAYLLGIVRTRPQEVDIATPRQRTVAGARIRRTRCSDGDVTSCRGIAVATVPRLLVDLAPECSKWELANLIHEAAYRDMVHVPTMERVLRRHARRSGHRTLVAAFDAWRAGDVGAMSRLELRALAMLDEAGVPEPRVNAIVDTLDGPLRVDLYWPKLSIYAEVDGHVVHGRPPTARTDAHRDRLLSAAGLTGFRLRERALTRDIAVLVDALRAAAEQVAASKTGGTRRASAAQPAPGAIPVYTSPGTR